MQSKLNCIQLFMENSKKHYSKYILSLFLYRFLLLPFSAFCLITIFEIQPLHAAGLLILASSPGGVTSNVFTFFCDGDLSLRYVCMHSFHFSRRSMNMKNEKTTRDVRKDTSQLDVNHSPWTSLIAFSFTIQESCILP